MRKCLFASTIVALLTVSTAEARFYIIKSVENNTTDQIGTTNVQFSLFHSASGGTTGGNHSPLELDENSGFNFWNPETGEFQLHLNVYNTNNFSGSPTATVVGKGTLALVPDGTDHKIPDSGLFGSITWTFDNIVAGSDIDTILSSDSDKIVTTNFHNTWSELQSTYTANLPDGRSFDLADIGGVQLWGNDAVTAGQPNGPSGGVLGIDLWVTLDGIQEGNTPVPEPGSFFLLALGCAGLGLLTWRRRRQVGMVA